MEYFILHLVLRGVWNSRISCVVNVWKNFNKKNFKLLCNDFPYQPTGCGKHLVGVIDKWWVKVQNSQLMRNLIPMWTKELKDGRSLQFIIEFIFPPLTKRKLYHIFPFMRPVQKKLVTSRINGSGCLSISFITGIKWQHLLITLCFVFYQLCKRTNIVTLYWECILYCHC